MNKIKKLASHLFNLPVKNVKSEYTPGLTLSYFKGRYMLSTENSVYSFGDEYTSYKKAFKRVQPGKRNIETVLILGYGIGSIPELLKSIHGVDAAYTGVDIDPAIIELAKKYGDFPSSSTLDLVCDDALHFLENTPLKYDLICVDVFIDDQVPSKFMNVEFLQLLKDHLTDKGMVLMSHMANNADRKYTAENFFYSTFFKVYPLANCTYTEGNMILIGI